MSLPLREPFFLVGQRNVLVRAVLMSVVLGGLSLIAGWGSILSMFVVSSAVPRDWSLSGQAVCSAVAITVFLVAPLNFWNLRPTRFLLICFLVVALTQLLMMWGAASLVDSDAQSVSYAIFGSILSTLGFGAVLVRHSTLHVAAWFVSVVLSAAIAIWTATVVKEILESGNAPGFSEAILVIVVSGLTIIGFALMTIPWGLPFWWPPSSRYLQDGSQAGRGAEPTSAV